MCCRGRTAVLDAGIPEAMPRFTNSTVCAFENAIGMPQIAPLVGSVLRPDCDVVGADHEGHVGRGGRG